MVGMSINQEDRQRFRELTRRYQQVAQLDVHRRTMQDWKRLNGLKPVRPMVMIDQIPWHEMNVDDELTLRCEAPFLRELEWGMRAALYKWKHFSADMAFYPFLQVPKAYSSTGIGVETRGSAEDALHAGTAIQVIDVSEHLPRRIPSAKWRDLIKKVWEADPLICPRCSKEMRIVSLIDQPAVIERILRHLGLWQEGVRVSPATGPPPVPVPGERIVEPWLDDPFPDYDTEPVMKYGNE